MGRWCSPVLSRQQALLTAAIASLHASVGVWPALCATSGGLPSPPGSIKARLDSRDSRLLLKPQNPGLAVPTEAAYPAWLEGEWSAAQSFAGYELPAKNEIPRDALFGEADVPGFKKCSIALLPDVGKEGVAYTLTWMRDTDGVVRESRAANLRSAVRGGLGYDAVERVDYKDDPNNRFGLGSNAGNPNRLKLVFAPGLTTNADRIELFINARQTELPEGRDVGRRDILSPSPMNGRNGDLMCILHSAGSVLHGGNGSAGNLLSDLLAPGQR